jgi:hypothetical protein
MARQYKQRFKVNPADPGDPNTPPSGSGSAGSGRRNRGPSSPAGGSPDDLFDKLNGVYERFQQGMIDAADASRLAATAIGRMGEAAGYTAKERAEMTAQEKDRYGTDPESQLYDRLDEITRRFRDGMIDATKASQLTASALSQLGEAAGFTAGEQKGEQRKADTFFGADPNSQLEQKLDAVYERFQKGLIGAEEASRQATAAITQLGEAAGYTAEEQAKSVEKSNEMYGADDRSRLEQAFDDALKKFTAGVIDADEAVRRQKAAIDQFGERLGMTLEERQAKEQEGFEAVGQQAAESGKQGPIDGKNPINQWIGSLGGKFGVPPEFTKSLMGMVSGGGGGIGNLLGGLGGGGGGGGGLAGIAGQAALPIAAVTAGAKVMEAFYGGVTDVTKRLTGVGQAIVKNDGVGAITGVMDGFGAAAKKVPIIGGMLEKQIGMYSQFIKSFDQITEAFRQRGEELKVYSGPIAAASANAKVERLLGDIREAQHLGNQYAQIIQEKTAAQVEFQRAFEPIKMALMTQIIPIMKTVTVSLKAYNDTNQKIVDVMLQIRDATWEILRKLGLDKAVEAIMENTKAINLAREEERARRQNEFLDDLFDVSRMGESAMDRMSPPDTNKKPMAVNLLK